ncbi:MAG: hypothetical protein ACMZ66_06650 [Thalassospira sp.]|uniref:hypothetical protein n=1 Tax=Thalassospira sp. TaxID=1912094 RepID=UPI003A869908
MADDDKTPSDTGTSTDANSDAKTDPSTDSTDAPKAAGASADSDASSDAGASGGDNGDKPASGSDSATPSSPADVAPNTPPLSTALNPQIVQAVGTTNHAVLNGAIPGANGVAYQKVAQAAAYAVQDLTDYLRNIMSMASATTGVAMQQMLAKKEVDPYADIIKAATQAVTDAQKTFSSVGTSASSVVKDFDSLA